MLIRDWRFWVVLCVVIIIVIRILCGNSNSDFIGIGDYDDVMAIHGIDEISDDGSSCDVQEKKCRKRCSKGEQKCRETLERLFGKQFPTKRPSFLRNPETGRNLELDCYNEDLELAVEYNGKQHYEYPNSFHKSKHEFIKQVRRDRYKMKMCDKNGVFLIVVPYYVKNIESYIIEKIPHTLIPIMGKKRFSGF